MKIKKILTFFLLAALSIGLLAVLICRHQENSPFYFELSRYSPAVLKQYVLGFGSWALAVFIILYAVNTISLLPPIGIMSLAAGFIFGPVLGTIGIMAGSFLGTSLTFFISRYFGANFVQKVFQGKAAGFQEKLNRNGFAVILFIRFIPLLPWEVVNYMSGLSKIKYRDYILATLLGIFPWVVVQTFFADRLSQFNLKDPALYIALGAFLLLAAVPVVYVRARHKKEKFDSVV